jgi:hypothetical protein
MLDKGGSSRFRVTQMRLSAGDQWQLAAVQYTTAA